MDNKPANYQDFIVAKVITPDKILFQGNALAISSKNQKGDFDIIPDHANFITVVMEKLVIVAADGSQKEYNFSTGIIHLYQGIAQIYLDIDV